METKKKTTKKESTSVKFIRKVFYIMSIVAKDPFSNVTFGYFIMAIVSLMFWRIGSLVFVTGMYVWFATLSANNGILDITRKKLVGVK